MQLAREGLGNVGARRGFMVAPATRFESES